MTELHALSSDASGRVSPAARFMAVALLRHAGIAPELQGAFTRAVERLTSAIALGHIRIDIVYGTLSERAKLIYDFLINLIIIMPPMILFGWAGINFAAMAYSTGEKLSTTNWFFPAGPPKTLIPVGFFLLALQCLAEIVRSYQKLKKGGPS